MAHVVAALKRGYLCFVGLFITKTETKAHVIRVRISPDLFR